VSTAKPGAPACLRCVPRRTPPTGRALKVGVEETPDGCACLVDCGAHGCTGAPQPVIDKPTRTVASKEGGT
jgi:hypothetical protein